MKGRGRPGRRRPRPRPRPPVRRAAACRLLAVACVLALWPASGLGQGAGAAAAPASIEASSGRGAAAPGGVAASSGRGASASGDVAALPASAPAPAPAPAAPAAPAGASAAPAAVPRTRIVAPGGTVDRLVNGEPVTLLRGPVVIERDSLTVRADSVLYYRGRDVYDAGGNVEVTQPGGVLTSRTATVRRREEAADFAGDVRVEDASAIGTAQRGESRLAGQLLRLMGEARLVSPEYTVWADTIVRDRRDETGEASGRVKIVDPAAQTVVTGEHARFRRREGTAVVDRDPVLTSRERGEGTLTGAARLMRFQRDPERVVMIDSVRIRQGRTDATADTAVIVGRERLLLRGAPCVRDGGKSTMTAREIELIYRESQLDRMLLVGGARIEDTEPESLAVGYRGLPRANVLAGDTIVVQFAAGRLARSTVLGAASSVYVPDDTEDEIAFNEVKGDTIVIDFQDERVRRVRVQGGMSGTYHFLRRDAADSAAVDSAGIDFQKRAEVVDYSGHRVAFHLAQRRIEVERKANLKYGSLTLTADKVRLDTVERELYAEGDPLLEDGAQKIVGHRMGYDFEHKSGAVRDGVTAEDQNFYGGDRIRRFDDGTLKIDSGRMTSCDRERPHYHFWARKMKIKMGERVVAAPVVVKIGEVPVFALPFYFKSLKQGRRSGILFPNFEFGWSQREGRYIRDWGYYWATNDYFDFTLRGDYNERRNLVLELINQYVKRYAFNGGFRYARQFSLDEAQYANRWQLSWNHDQNRLFDAYAFRAAVDMSSSQLENSYLGSDVGRDIIPGQLQSNVYLSRSWSGASGSLSATRSQRINAEDGLASTDQSLWTMTAPRLALNFSRRPLLPPLPAGRRGSALGDLLRSVYFSHRYDAVTTAEAREESRWRTTSGSGSVSVDAVAPRLGGLNLRAGVQASQAWNRLSGSGRRFARYDTTWVTPDSSVVTPVFADLDSVRETTRPSLSINSSAGTTLYGVFPVRLGRLRAIRHTLTLSAAHSWQPSLGDKQAQSSSFSFAVGNRFDVKYLAAARDSAAVGAGAGRAGGPATDQSARGAGRGGGAASGGARRDDRVRKLDGLLDWSLATTYSPDRPAGRRWSDISSGIVIKPGRSQNLNLDIRNTLDSRTFAVKSTAVNYGLSLAGRLDVGARPEAPEARRRADLERLGARADSAGAAVGGGHVPEEQEPAAEEGLFAGYPRQQRSQDGQDPTGGGQFIPWRLSSRFSYTRDNRTGYSSKRVSVMASANLTPSWDFSYDASLDLEAGQILRQNWRLTRDLHCWALEFTRIVSTVDSQFGFRLYLKSIPAVELTRGRRDLLGTAQSFAGGGFF